MGPEARKIAQRRELSAHKTVESGKPVLFPMIDNSNIHRAITKVLLREAGHGVMKPVRLGMIASLVLDELGVVGVWRWEGQTRGFQRNWKDKLRIMLTVVKSDKYLVLPEGVVMSR